MNLAEAIPVVTGANRGLGLQLVRAFSAAGCPKVYAACRLPEKFPGPVNNVELVTLDLCDPQSIEAAARHCADATILVNNAAALKNTPLLDVQTLDGALAEMETNFWGALRCCRAFAPLLRERKNSAIVTILSIGVLANIPFAGSYCASKAAAASMMQCLRAELNESPTNVISVFAGPMVSDMARKGEIEGRHDTAEVAGAILHAIGNGEENVFPDETSRELGRIYGHGPWELEKRHALLL